MFGEGLLAVGRWLLAIGYRLKVIGLLGYRALNCELPSGGTREFTMRDSVNFVYFV